MIYTVRSCGYISRAKTKTPFGVLVWMMLHLENNLKG